MDGRLKAKGFGDGISDRSHPQAALEAATLDNRGTCKMWSYFPVSPTRRVLNRFRYALRFSSSGYFSSVPKGYVLMA